MPHFKLTNETIYCYGHTLHRIVATEEFMNGITLIQVGQKGGYVEGLNNIKDNAWVSDNAHVIGYACVAGNARVANNVVVTDNAHVTGNAWVAGNAIVVDKALVSGDARVTGDTYISGRARIYYSANIERTRDHLVIGPIGSRSDYTTFYRTDNGIYVSCGCFNGSLSDFRKKVAETHRDNLHAKIYEAAAQIAELQIRVVNDGKG